MNHEITVAPDGNVHRLMVTSHGRTMPAGARLLRGGEIPYITFTHTERAHAERDAQLLRDYLAGLDTSKPSKMQARKHAANL